MTKDSASVGIRPLTASFARSAGSAGADVSLDLGEVPAGIVAGNLVAKRYAVVAGDAALIKPTTRALIGPTAPAGRLSGQRD